MNTNKKCNFCKEEILNDATVCKHCGKKQPSVIKKRIYQSILILFVIGIIRSSFSDGSSTSQPVVESVKIGENAHLTISGNNPVLVAINKSYYDEMMKLVAANDTTGLAQMSLDGKILLVDKSTAVKVIDASYFSSEVRINEGKYIGQAGWVPNEMVIR
ncbi:MAG: hypothetical protein WCT07_00905 [Candidatus Paceibacterota bacterium]|jgi:hypothetical protein